MKTSPRGIAFIKDFEKCRLSAYADSKGVWTIGWGHTGPDVYQGVKWAQSHADATLIEDLVSAERCVNTSVRCKLSQAQFDALVSLVYNIGAGAFGNSTIRRMLNLCDTVGAALQFRRWNKVTHADGRVDVVAGLTLRRAAEAALFKADY